MKNYIKGIITGIIIGAVVCSIPALADTIDALFNNVRISVNGVDQIQWGENIQLADGAETPASILYNGTTYLPMRKLGELSGNKIYWNGDSRTVGMTGAQKDIKVIAEKPDKNGNVWKYYTFKDSNDKNYLGVKDEARGYERVYRLACDTMNVTDNEIYFALYKDGERKSKEFVKMSFDNDESSQDGYIIETDIWLSEMDDILFDGDLFITSGNSPTNGAHGTIVVYNYVTKEYARYTENAWNTRIHLLSAESDSTRTHIKYRLVNNGGEEFEYQIDFDKTTNTFSEPNMIERNITE